MILVDNDLNGAENGDLLGLMPPKDLAPINNFDVRPSEPNSGRGFEESKIESAK